MSWRSLFVRRPDLVSDSVPTGQLGAVEPAPPSSPPEPSGPSAVDDRLDTVQAFRRFVGRVMLCADRWLAHRGVPPADRDDVLQEALLQTYARRASYDPAISTWEDWAFGYVGKVVLNYRRARARRTKRVDVALVALPDIAVDGPNAEEETEADMRQALLDKCMASLDDDSRAILHARAEGRMWSAIAAALGVSVATARRYYDAARAELQEALDREQGQKRALGLAVFPLSIDQLIASDSTPGHVTAHTMDRLWKSLDGAMAADVKAGKLRDDGSEVERYMGSPDAPPRPPRPNLGARLLRALGPRGRSALSHLGAAAVAAGVTYAIMKPGPAQKDKDAEVRSATSSTVAQAGYPRGSAPTEAAAPSTAGSSSPVEEPDLRADAGAPERTAAGSGSSTTARQANAAEQDIFDLGNTAYQAGAYEDAIKQFEEHARTHPRGRFAAPRDRLWTLALIRMGRKTEARQRIDQLRRANPQSKTLAELEAALNPAN